MSAAFITNLVINAYADFSAVFNLEDNNSGDPLNLTDYQVASQMRKHAGSSSAVSLGATVYNSLLGQVKVSLGKTETGQLKPGRYVYDVLIINPSGKTERVVEGMVLVKEGATHS